MYNGKNRNGQNVTITVVNGGAMIEQLNQAIIDYRHKWQRLEAQRANTSFFTALQPISVGWKVADITVFDTVVTALRQHSDHVHLTYKNDRWLATLHLRDIKLEWGITVVNIMQRRPDSQDATGLDNVNFYVPHFALTEEVLAAEPNLKWSHESNGPYSNWIAIWFDGTEAKLRAETVLDVDIRAFRDVRDRVLKGKGCEILL
jgi:hypothetical protein